MSSKDVGGHVRVVVHRMLSKADIGRARAGVIERVGMLVNRCAYWQRAWDALYEETHRQRTEIERLFMVASIHSSDRERVRLLALAEVLDALDGRSVDLAQRIKDIESKLATERERGRIERRDIKSSN